ncbi:MAG TPA: helix-turn-helix transcriptional regulator [Anaerovoracaceae bacterium]|nr:helix-turn-helix transcriptional regulator [Anaerovoracaceae bacterium]HZX21299.1 helix-turn-helix transcriptional regulator [Clostridia bacterium]
MPKILLREIRRQRGISQLELSKQSGVSYGYISELEHNKKSPTVNTICRLAKALDCRPGELFRC